MAFAGSDHFGSVPAVGDYPTTHSMVSGAVDMSSTKSIVADSAAGANATSAMPAPGYGQGIWGR
jgi:hypothetical protein